MKDTGLCFSESIHDKYITKTFAIQVFYKKNMNIGMAIATNKPDASVYLLRQA